MSRSKNAGLAGRVYDLLAEHGPLTSYSIAERLGITPLTASSACGHLVRLDKIIPLQNAAFRPVGAHGRRCHRWEVNLQPQRASADTARRIDRNAGITADDHEWMRRYREQRARRMAQMGEQRCS